MAIHTLESALYGDLFDDPELQPLLSDAAEIGAMITAEKALARVQGKAGMIPAEAALALETALDRVMIDPGDLRAATARDGVVAPGLVAALRKQIDPDLAPWLHWGATSQDIADLALVLRLRAVIDLFDSRLEALVAALAELARAHRDTPCLARTRTQIAAPTLFGLRVANWLQPLQRHRQRLHEIRPRLQVVQLGGAAGNLSAFGPRGLEIMDALADDLGLGRAEPWHGGRDRLVEFGLLLVLIATSIGRIGADLVSLAQSETGELGFEGAGGSSTLPQKQNPVIAEVLVALGRSAAGQGSGLPQAALHATERDGAAWTLEWLTLPPLMATTGAALRLAREAVSRLRVDTGRMVANLAATRELVMAEAATFALAAASDRNQAAAIVREGIQAMAQDTRPLLAVLEERSPVAVDWEALRDPLNQLEPARMLIDRILAGLDT
ncbi:lyase family protein [Rhabdaerophilum sp. SD176]|uniref:lyase family protein n=1 Tax=Rhabdaerophilum sp. SD176 TaxID=2983548 RepID=UPI0024DFDBB0|nr:lyase family protein [Rhabdaerophilum sp. SD176]